MRWGSPNQILCFGFGNGIISILQRSLGVQWITNDVEVYSPHFKAWYRRLLHMKCCWFISTGFVDIFYTFLMALFLLFKQFAHSYSNEDQNQCWLTVWELESEQSFLILQPKIRGNVWTPWTVGYEISGPSGWTTEITNSETLIFSRLSKKIPASFAVIVRATRPDVYPSNLMFDSDDERGRLIKGAGILGECLLRHRKFRFLPAFSYPITS